MYLVQKILFSVKNFLMICGIALPLYAREITLGTSEKCIENQNTINHVRLSLKCYIKVEKNSTFYISSKQTEEINKLNGLMLRRQ